MPTSLPVKEVPLKQPLRIGEPRVLFTSCLLATVAAGAVAAHLLPAGWMIPVAATLLFMLTGAVALIAWRVRKMDPQQITFWDVAGALFLIGICAAATIEPDQMVQLVEHGRIVQPAR